MFADVTRQAATSGLGYSRPVDDPHKAETLRVEAVRCEKEGRYAKEEEIYREIHAINVRAYVPLIAS